MLDVVQFDQRKLPLRGSPCLHKQSHKRTACKLNELSLRLFFKKNCTRLDIFISLAWNICKTVSYTIWCISNIWCFQSNQRATGNILTKFIEYILVFWYEPLQPGVQYKGQKADILSNKGLQVSDRMLAGARAR